MERRGVGKRLTDGQRVEIIKLFDSGAAVTEADIARRYGVTRSAIWRLRRSSSHIMERYQEGDIESRDDRRRGSGANSAIKQVAVGAATTTPANVSGASGEMDPNAAFMTTSESALLFANAVGNSGNRALRTGGMTTTSTVGGPRNPGMDDSNGETDASGLVVTTAGVVPLEPMLPLIYMAAKAIGSIQSPGIMNWERQNGYDDASYFAIVNDGIVILQDGNFQINVDLHHSQARQNYKFTFKVWNSKKLLGQCTCPLRTKKEISLSMLEVRCHLQAQAKLRIEYLAPGFAFHESRVVLRLVQ